MIDLISQYSPTVGHLLGEIAGLPGPCPTLIIAAIVVVTLIAVATGSRTVSRMFA